MKRILAPTELTGVDSTAMAWACDLARRYDATLVLYHAIDHNNPHLRPVDVRNVARHARTELERIAKTLPLPLVETFIEHSDDVATSIVDLIKRERIDMVVMPSGTTRALRWFMVGSVSERVLRHSPVPVLATDPRDVRSPGELIELRSILVPTDFSADADAALRAAEGLAAEYRVPLHVLHVCEEPKTIGFEVAGAESILTLRPDLRERYVEMIEQRTKTLSVRSEAHVAAGNPAAEILGFVKRSDVGVVVMATQGHDSISDRFLGSTTERVVRSLELPVLVIGGETVVGQPADDTVETLAREA